MKAPVHVTLEIDEDKVIANFDAIEAFSYADTVSEAIDLLCDEIIQVPAHEAYAHATAPGLRGTE